MSTTDLLETISHLRAHIATLEAALKRVYDLANIDCPAEPVGLLGAIATAIERVPGIIAERGGL